MSDYFINLGIYKSNSFIPTKSTEKDSSIILNMKISKLEFAYLLAFDLLHFKYEEIISDNDKIVKGPIILKIDLNKFNNFNSIGIQSNETYYIRNQNDGNKYVFGEESNLTIITQNYFKSYYTNIFIVFLDDKYSFLEIKKFDYPIYSIYIAEQVYIPLYHKNDYKNEIYLYSSKNYYTSLYGNFTINITYKKKLTLYTTSIIVINWKIFLVLLVKHI